MDMNELTHQEIIRLLNLEPLVGEGGLFRQTYKSNVTIPKSQLSSGYSADRAIATQIYYLLTDDANSFSALHRLLSDEVYHFYLGDPVEMLLLYENGITEVIQLGSDILRGQHVQFLVPGQVWQGAYLKPGGKFALLGTSVIPGFELEDFELGIREELIKEYEDQRIIIEKLTRPQ